MSEKTDSKFLPPEQAKRWSRKRVRSMMRERRASLRTLATSRVYGNRPIGKPDTWAFFVAEIAWLRYRDGGTLKNFRRAAPAVPPYFVISDAVAKKALRKVGRLKKLREACGESYRPTSPAKLGKMLGVTALEIEELDLKTIRPADWTAELAAAERKQRDRDRKREARRKASAKDRQDEAKRKRKWRARRGRGLARAAKAERRRAEIAASGKSKATYYRHRETERVRPPILPCQSGRTPLVSPAAAASQTNGAALSALQRRIALSGTLVPPEIAKRKEANASEGKANGAGHTAGPLACARGVEGSPKQQSKVAELRKLTGFPMQVVTMDIAAVDRVFGTLTMEQRH